MFVLTSRIPRFSRAREEPHRVWNIGSTRRSYGCIAHPYPMSCLEHLVAELHLAARSRVSQVENCCFWLVLGPWLRERKESKDEIAKRPDKLCTTYRSLSFHSFRL